TLLAFLLCAVFGAKGQRHQLTITDGYGSGMYAAGDTAYVFSRELAANEVFLDWNTSVPSLNIIADPQEWRMAFVMPAHDVSLRANFDTIPSSYLQYRELVLAGGLKPMYYAFPANHRGTVFIFHGTGGDATGWLGPQRDPIIKELYYEGFGVVITESEESSRKQDLNGDNKIRWQGYPVDSVANIDYANMKNVMDTLEAEGLLDRSELYALGMSNGGSFTGTFSTLFGAKAGVIYCASSQRIIAQTTQTHLQFCMMPRDSTIGKQGNDDGFTFHTTIKNRGLCSDYFMNIPFPIYPEYFQRIGIPANASNTAYQELQTNLMLDSKGFLLKSDTEIQQDIQQNPANWPLLGSASATNLDALLGLLKEAYAGHKFFTNHNKRSIAFLKDPCATSTYLEPVSQKADIRLFPNPAINNQVFVQGVNPPFQLGVYDQMGRLLLSEKSHNTAKVTLPEGEGLFFISIRKRNKHAFLKVLN
ncbi:MAG: T9SS type A sorting domain-containing protein, partial [Bacteroidia bacterium]